MTLSAGTRLGPYEIVAPIGAGGMGEVYKARDTRLDRTVAIKVLPAGLAADPDRRRRFEQEARAVAALDHPYICALHDVGSRDGIDFLIMAYLDGETLAARLCRGPLPLAQAVEVGRAGRGRAACRAREGDRPPRPEAGQHHADAARTGEGARLRPGKTPGGSPRRRFRCGDCVAAARRGESDGEGCRGRDGVLHVT